MKREIIITKDGSTTIHLPNWNEKYHSKHGAIQEAYHVFIEMGLFFYLNKNNTDSLVILEIGFGTGLNAFITLLEAKKNKLQIEYIGIDAYPVDISEINKLNYPIQLNIPVKYFLKLHTTDWERPVEISKSFTLVKRKKFFSEIDCENTYDIIYFDAFSARVQPEIWTESIFQKMYNALIPKGILVTYSAKGSVRRALQTVGFTVERLSGPPGKRHMLRAIKK